MKAQSPWRRERLVLGPDHPGTVTAQANLAVSYPPAGPTAEAIAINEQVVTDRERLLGPDHPHTVTARNNLATMKPEGGIRETRRC